MSEKRAGNISSGQKEILIEFLNNHPQLVSAKFSSQFSHKNAQTLWCQLTETLNALPGAKKTWDQWRKTWHDMKTKAKGKKADIKQSLTKTGGGPPSEISMTSIENDITKLIGPTTIYGDASVDESIVEFALENVENDNIIEIYPTDNNINISNNISDNDNILKHITSKRKLDSIIEIREESSMDCEKENYPSVSKKSDNNLRLGIGSKKGINSKNNSNTEPVEKITVPLKGRTRNRFEQRFDDTFSYTKSLTTNVQNDLKIRADYYDKKLHLMERDIIAKERIAAAMENFCAIIKSKQVI